MTGAPRGKTQLQAAAETLMRMERSDAILNARHLVASANGALLQASGQVTRALAWQLKNEASIISDLETAIEAVTAAQRQLHEAVAELRIATRGEEGA